MSPDERMDAVLERRWEIISERNTLLSAHFQQADPAVRARIAEQFLALEIEAEALLASVSTLH